MAHLMAMAHPTLFVSVLLLFAYLVLAVPTQSSLSVLIANGTTTATHIATSAASALNSTAVPSPTSPIHDKNSTTTVPAHNVTTAAHPTTTKSSVTNASPASSAPTGSATVTLDPDLAILAPRRVEFAIAQQIGANSVPGWIASLGADGKWPDSEVDYTTGCPARRANWPAQGHWQRLGALAAAWHGGFAGVDPKYVKDSALRAQISTALDWWFERDFTVDGCLDNGGTASCPCDSPGLWNTNWFSNVILIPRLVGQTCLMLNATLTSSQLGNCTHMTSRTYSTFMRSEPPSWLVGANLLDIASIGIASGVLTGNDSVVADAYARVHEEVTIRSGFQVDGILPDGSFGQHSGLLYNGNYGKDYTNDVLELEIEGGGTRFAAAGESRTAFESLMNASQWMVYQNTKTGGLHWDFSTEGRFISFPVVDDQATASLKINLSEVQELGELWDSAVLRNVYEGLTTNTSTANVGNVIGTRMFWNNDYLVTRGKNYVSTVKMYSSRTRNSECTNTQNPVGFHLADGTTYTYVRGDEYEDISAAWDWNLIPGTTVDYGGTPLTCDTENHAGLESFVGGVSNGKIGAAVMRYTNPINLGLTFQKAWFHFPHDVQHVMISILAANGDAPVFSVLDQRTLRGPIYVNAVPVKSANFSHPRTLFHADTGYYFVNAPALSISAGSRTGNWSAIGTSTVPPETVDLFAAWIPHDTHTNSSATSHGKNPNQSIEYTVFPGRKRWEFEAEVLLNPLHTLRADTEVSAVQDRVHGTTMMVFWQPEGGTVDIPDSWSITVDSACIIILDQHASTVTIADPTQELESVEMTIHMRGKSKAVIIELPTGPLAGSSVETSI